VTNRAETDGLVQRAIVKRSVDFWNDEPAKVGVPCAPITPSSRCWATGLIVKYDHPHGGPIQSVGLPFVLGDEPREAGTPPPLRGEHTQAILREMGFSSQQIKELRAVEAIARAFHSPMCPLGKGFLTGKIDQSTKFVSTDFRNVLPHFTPKARKPVRRSSRCWRSSPNTGTRRRPRSLSHGCWRRSRGSFRFRARPNWPA
jgi:hypothetical protein